jgi:FAD/FMN-containing dehydrogenase
MKAAAWGAQRSPIRWNFKPEDAGDLQKRIMGSVVLPIDSAYTDARQAFVANYQAFPQIVVYCEVIADVPVCLDFAKAFDLHVTCRSGGHSTAGYSVNSGMVIDLGRLNDVTVDPVSKRAVVGAGTSFGKLNAVLDSYRLHVPGGGCEDVCVGGYMQGGGYGLTSLMYGMNCDNVEEILVALHDGTLVIANETENPDLFWAVRGGTGNNFGVVLQVTYRLHDLWRVWGFGIRWPLEKGAKALQVMQEQFSGIRTPGRLGYMTLLLYLDGEPWVLMRGVYDGPESDGRDALKPLLDTPGADLDFNDTGSYRNMNRAVLSAPTDLPPVPPHVRTEADCRFVARELGEDGWQKIVDYVGRSPNDGNFICLEPYGGAINRIEPDAAAFNHRDASFDVFTWVFWLNEEERRATLPYLDDFVATLDPLCNGRAYQNYPRRENADFAAMYWGDALNRLKGIKGKFDPHDFFRYQQSVPQPDGGAPVAAGPIQQPQHGPWRPTPASFKPAADGSGGEGI